MPENVINFLLIFIFLKRASGDTSLCAWSRHLHSWLSTTIRYSNKKQRRVFAFFIIWSEFWPGPALHTTHNQEHVALLEQQCYFSPVCWDSSVPHLAQLFSCRVYSFTLNPSEMEKVWFLNMCICVCLCLCMCALSSLKNESGNSFPLCYKELMCTCSFRH